MANGRTLRTFYTLVVTQTISLIGSEMTSFAVGIWVYRETGSATALALAAFFAAVPRLLAPSFAGPLADRYDRRYVMVLADAGQALGTLLLMISFMSGAFELWHLYLVAAIQATFGMFQGPAFQASVTMLVPDAQRDRANAILQIRGHSAGLVAPAVAGLLVTVIGAAGVMAVDLLTFSVAMVVVALAHIPRPAQTAEGRAMQGSLWQQALVGFRYLAARRPLFLLVVSTTLVNFFFNMVGVLFTPYVLSITGSEATLGTLMSVMSAAAIGGAILMGAWGGTRPRIHTIMPGIVVAGLFFAGAGVARHPVTLGIALIGLMLPMPMVNAALDSLLQAKVAPDVQGRVFATVGQLAMLFSPISYLLAGPLADRVFEPAVGGEAWSAVAPLVGSQAGSGMGLMAVIAGSLVALTGLAFYLMPAVRQAEATLPDFAPAAEEAARGGLEGRVATAAAD